MTPPGPGESDSEASLLGVRSDAPLADIKRAYRKAALAHHPDQNSHPEAARHFRRLTEAYRALEARALVREPARPRREPSLSDRVGFVLGDVKLLVRRWPAERWATVVDGLPTAVWVASALEVLAQRWPGAPVPSVAPSVEGIAQALADWEDRRTGWPLPPTLARSQAKALADAVRAAEVRLRALDRPARKSPK
ncbi:MAG TPA: J domain-containing protein [Spirochaetia bacterium]|nr:J domain-containing protein [Spirochaetia bacterium]